MASRPSSGSTAASCRSGLALAVGLLALLAAAGCGRAQEPERKLLERSDVVLMGSSTLTRYKQYSATVITWGGRPYSDAPDVVERYSEDVRAARAMGIRYVPHAAFRMAYTHMIDYDPGFMDSVCRTLDGEPIVVPWLRYDEYKGYPAYWFCTNAPRYRDYLRYQMKHAFDGGADGVQVDDYGGTYGTRSSAGGCFGPHCMAAFREYVAQNVPGEQLAALGIRDLDAFDYGEFLRGRGVTAEQFKAQAGAPVQTIPLGHAYDEFQLAAAMAWLEEFHRYCEGRAGHALPLAVSCGAGSPTDLHVAPLVTFFCAVVGHAAAEGGISAAPVWSYKLADALGRPMACTARAADWAYLQKGDRVGLVGPWMAQAYAFGCNFMPPVHQWTYTPEKGTDSWTSQPGQFDFICRFIRDSAQWLDGYETVARIGLLYSNAAFRRHEGQVREACRRLVEMNVPFRVILAGDDRLDERLEPDDLAGLKALVYTEPTYLDAAQQAVLDGAKDMAVLWPDEERLLELAPPMIEIEGAPNVTAVARARPGDPKASVVCHLVNRNYVSATDSMAVQRDFVLRLSDELFGAGIKRAHLYAPARKPRKLKVRRVGAGTEITIPELDFWAILRLERR